MTRLLPIPIVALAMVCLPMFGCATSSSQEVTASDYSKPRETVRAAQATGADEVPRAKLYVNYATDEIRKADQFLEDGDHHHARMALSRAQADADLALTLAQERRTAEQVREIEHRIERLDRQIDQQD